MFSSSLFSSDLCLKCFLRFLDKLGRERKRVCGRALMHACSVMSDSWRAQFVCVCAVMFNSAPPPARLLHPNTEVGCHFLIQGIFLT